MAKRIYKKTNRRKFKRSMKPNYIRPMVDNQYQPIYAEATLHTSTLIGTQTLVFLTGNRFHNFAQILVDSVSYQQIKAQFARVKITALEFFITDASSTTNIESGFNPKALPVSAFNVYPGKTGVDLGDGPLYSDDSLHFHSGVNAKGYKKFDFNKKLLDRGSLTAGEWIDPLLESGMYGQISVSEYALPASIAQVRVHNVRVRILCLFSSRLI